MNFFVSNFISVIAAAIAAAFILNRFFKNSVFFRVGLIWLFNLLFIVFSIGVKVKFFEGQTLINIIFTLVNVGVSVLCFYYGSIAVVRPLEKAVDEFNELGKGNLKVKIDKSKANEKKDLGRLILAADKIHKSLTAIVHELNSNVDSISGTSDKLNGLSTKLSAGATEQASSVEEISSSMEEMAANIQQNTENAQQTEKIAKGVSEGVMKVGVSSKESLSSIKEIAEKINIINDIAFQTNILALNAAVEAARAGEHGKGFAVVASEVRKLAERSKLAADDIVNLAHKSVNITENSAQLMESLIPEIEKTSKLIQEIAAASYEQSMGANQINNALQQLNVLTQQNALSSDEMALGSKNLDELANELKVITVYFKIE